MPRQKPASHVGDLVCFLYANAVETVGYHFSTATGLVASLQLSVWHVVVGTHDRTGEHPIRGTKGPAIRTQGGGTGRYFTETGRSGASFGIRNAVSTITDVEPLGTLPAEPLRCRLLLPPTPPSSLPRLACSAAPRPCQRARVGKCNSAGQAQVDEPEHFPPVFWGAAFHFVDGMDGPTPLVSGRVNCGE
jgi:hypothetical protein